MEDINVKWCYFLTEIQGVLFEELLLCTTGIFLFDAEDFLYICHKVACTLRKELWNPLLLQSHMTFVYLQRNIVDNNKVNSQTDIASCVPFVFAKGIIGVHCPLGKTKWFIQHNLMI